MEKTKINDQPYSKELKQEIVKRNSDWLNEQREYTAGNGDWNSLGHKLTIKFTKDDGKNGLSLDFQTNSTWVTNKTDYETEPKNGFIKRYFSGNVKNFNPMIFNNFISMLKNSDVYDIGGVKIYTHIIDPNWDIENDNGSSVTRVNKFDSVKPDISSKIEEFEKSFLMRQDFRIDPESDVRFVHRVSRKGDTNIYTASITTKLYRGLSSAPGHSQIISSNLTAKTHR